MAVRPCLAALALLVAGCDRPPSRPAQLTAAPAPPAAIQRTLRTNSGEASLAVAMSIDRAELTVADRVLVTLTCSTRAGAALSLPSFDQRLGDFTLVSSENSEQANAAGGRDTITRLVLEPFLFGDKTIPSIAVEATDAGRTLSLKTEPVTLRVSPVAADDANDKTPLDPAKSPVALLVSPRRDYTLVGALAGGVLILTVGTIVSLSIVSARRARRAADPAVRVKLALNAVRARLGASCTHAEAAEVAEELFRAVAGYLCDAWTLPADTRPLAQCAPLIASLDAMHLDARAELARLLADLERTRFAPDAASVPVVQTLLDRCIAFIDRNPAPPTMEDIR
jgi:hypothetical protein